MFFDELNSQKTNDKDKCNTCKDPIWRKTVFYTGWLAIKLNTEKRELKDELIYNKIT